MTKISQLTDIGANLAANDEFIIRDVSDASTPNKKVTASGFFNVATALGLAGLDTIVAGVANEAKVQVFASGISGRADTTISGVVPARTTISGYFENASGTVGGTLFPVVTQTDIGTDPNQVPINGYLGTMAFQDSDGVNLGTASIGTASIGTASIGRITNALIDLGTAAAPTINFTGDTNTGIYSPGSDTFAISTGGSERARFDSNGVLSIGTTSSSSASRLNIVQTTNTDNTTPTVYIERNQAGAGGNSGMTVGLQVNIPTTINNSSATGIKVYTGIGLENTAYAIDAESSKANNGVVRAARFTGGHGNTHGYGTQNVVDIIAGVAGGGPHGRVRGLYIQNPNYNYTGGNGQDIGICLNDLTTAAVTHTAIEFQRDSSTVGTITTTLTATAYNTSSDYRLKENIVTLDSAIDRLISIPVHRFNFISNPDQVVDGFLAHEVALFVPEAITGQKDEVQISPKMDENNQPILDNAGQEVMEEKPVYQSIDQSKLVPLLTAALQEAIAKIASLEARLIALEAN